MRESLLSRAIMCGLFLMSGLHLRLGMSKLENYVGLFRLTRVNVLRGSCLERITAPWRIVDLEMSGDQRGKSKHRYSDGKHVEESESFGILFFLFSRSK